ncbi:hypothetical protein BESB_020440 [Besnoitia besnoiti]|uniref:Uncharacterized protein n=1 Tax=Besnoitia besnoiti TaxID=94643 RepID=A0A2A9M8T5_BESBE|nr:hypothetical protein BESB_020440 [Besnoitia besnoiti]PFH32103.1 hypothetical protein BESB_020440 [Besnoitia besnoiti]
MEPLRNLDKFIEKCDTSEMRAFLQHVQERQDISAGQNTCARKRQKTAAEETCNRGNAKAETTTRSVKGCELEQRAANTVAAFHTKREELARLHAKQLESFRRSALRRLDQARAASYCAVSESCAWDERMDEVFCRLMLLRQTLHKRDPADEDPGKGV